MYMCVYIYIYIYVYRSQRGEWPCSYDERAWRTGERTTPDTQSYVACNHSRACYSMIYAMLCLTASKHVIMSRIACVYITSW